MKTWRNNPECKENTEATKQYNREVFALKMQFLSEQIIGDCIHCGQKLSKLDSFCPNCEKEIE